MTEAPPHRSVRIEADGGSRGNPGPAAFGAVLFDADTGEVIAERAECIGRATNNVAEYNGLIAGLELFHEHTPDADLEVRMDSKLVVEQMSGRWRVKHPGMVPLASRAQQLAPFGTTYTWIPREQNKHADRILNEALDAQAGKPPRRPPAERDASADDEAARRPVLRSSAEDEAARRPVLRSSAEDEAARRPVLRSSAGDEAARRPVLRSSAGQGWGALRPATTLVLVRHGVTAHTVDKRFSGGLGGSNPGLAEEGRNQVRATADWLAPLADDFDVVVSSPVRRTHESAEILGARLDKRVLTEPGLAEMEFGSWEGLTFAELRERHPDDLDAWLGSLDQPAGGGESFRVVEERVLASLDRLLQQYAGRTVLVVSHVTPIKVLVTRALGAPLESVHRMELAPASVSVLSFYDDGNASMRMFNARPPDAAFTAR